MDASQGKTLDQIFPEVRSSLPVADSIMLYLSVILEDDQANQLLSGLPGEDYQRVEPHLNDLMSIPSRDRYYPLLDEVQIISHEQPYHGLEEMDGSWILHYLKDEKPAVIGLILKHLPADKVYQVLNRLDPEIRVKLPDPENLDKVSKEVVHIVKHEFESQLSTFPKPRIPKVLSFECVRNLSSTDLTILVQDIGLSLLSLAFQGVNERSLIELVKNLDEEEAEKLFQKFSEQKVANRGDVKTAQLEILSLSLDFENSTDLILEAGVQRLARAILREEDSIIELLQHKLPLKAGYQLQRYVADFRRGTHSDSAIHKLREIIVGRLFALSKMDEIESSWAKLPRGQFNRVQSKRSLQ